VRTVEVRILDNEDVVGRLTDMQVWLNSRRSEQSHFTHFYLDRGMKIQVVFALDDEADEFAVAFSGLVSDPNEKPP
jgi:hypothetical protein